MLGLAEQVGRDVLRISARVGEHGDLGRPGLRVDTDDAAHEALRRSDEDVAGPRDDIDGLCEDVTVLRQLPRRAVGEHRDQPGTADRVHLVDAQQRARREDRRVGQAAVLRLAAETSRRASEPLGALRRDDVHATTDDGYTARPPGT